MSNGAKKLQVGANRGAIKSSNGQRPDQLWLVARQDGSVGNIEQFGFDLPKRGLDFNNL